MNKYRPISEHIQAYANNPVSYTHLVEQAQGLEIGCGTSPTWTNAGYEYVFRGTQNAASFNTGIVELMTRMGVTRLGTMAVSYTHLDVYKRQGQTAPKTSPISTGIGLSNVNERIQLYFGKHYGAYITSVPGTGTEVHIHLPKLKEEEDCKPYEDSDR